MTDAGPELERSYRRLLRLYPSRWRRHREEEVLAVLLQLAAPDQVAASSAERNDLLLAAGREHVRVAQGAARRAPGRTSALAVLVLGTGLLLVTADPPVRAEPAALPATLPAYSYLTQSVSTSPPGPAVAVYRQGTGAELADLPQAVVVGAGARSPLDLAEDRDEAMQGSPGSFLLSPDGLPRGQRPVRHRRQGRHRRPGPDHRRSQHQHLLGYPSAHPVAWTPDGTAVLVSLGELPWLAAADQPVEVPPARLALVGLDGGQLPLPVGVPADAGRWPGPLTVAACRPGRRRRACSSSTPRAAPADRSE